MSISFAIHCCEGWCDITDDVEVTDAPWTLAKPDGVGAFQFSIATYKSGRIPDPTPESLQFLLRDFAISHELGEPADIVTEAGELRIAAGSFLQGDSFIRAWYISDGRSFARVTYISAFGQQQAELSDCERMVRTLRFTNEAVS
jgi:hypothetical protein